MLDRSLNPRRPAPRRFGLLAVAVGLALSACGGGSGSSGGQSGIVGEIQPKPGGGNFFVDPNGSGGSARLRLTDLYWGRLVDVFAVDAMGDPNPAPTYVDFLIEPGILTDGVNYRLETSAVTQQTNLIILEMEGTAAFETLLRESFDNLPTVDPQNTNGTTTGPFTQVPRNAAVSLRFDDCLDDSAAATSQLPSTVRVFTGYTPSVPFDARLFFDPNFGALVGADFHSTRVIVDLTVTQQEAQALPTPPPVNGLGLPASVTTSSLPNVAIEIPTEEVLIAGQFDVLRNLRGNELTFDENGPRDTSSPTRDVVRGFRAGNQLDPNNGFLLDPLPPSILGSWPISTTSVVDVGAVPGFDFTLTLNFPTVCQDAPAVGDVININGFFLEVTADGATPDVAGDVPLLAVTSASEVPLASSLQGSGLFLSPYDPNLAVDGTCWVTFTPPPGTFPNGDISPTAQISVRFSEPMDPSTVAGMDDFLVVRTADPDPLTEDNQPAPSEIVVGTVTPSSDLLNFAFAPSLPLTHTNTVADPYFVRVDGPLDLAGNAVVNDLPDLEFTLDPLAATEDTGSFALRFDRSDELGTVDLSGQAFYDLDRGVLFPRSVSFQSAVADRNQVPASIQLSIPGGVRDPLTPLGSKLQTLWRYVDLGWAINDPSLYNLDVIGVNWSPFGGQVIADFYEEFEILLAHSNFLPDEFIGMNGPQYANSGLNAGPALFTSNLLPDPGSPQTVVHSRAQGYTINPSDIFLSNSGTLMMPFPINRSPGVTPRTFTWRDTAVEAVAGPGNNGIPMAIENQLNILPPDPVNGGNLAVGSIAGAGMIPTIGLPLLMEVRCYPSNSGIGLNSLDANTVIAGTTIPNFRAWSSGGIDTNGGRVIRNPDLETFPRGGFNPLSAPTGQPTQVSSDNTFYIGQIDTVSVVSRAFTAFFDSAVPLGVNFRPSVQLPAPDQQPVGTSIRLDYRGATMLTGTSGLDASDFDAYGNLMTGTAAFLDGTGSWSQNIDSADTARYLQVRITFMSNLETGLTAELAALGILFEE